MTGMASSITDLAAHQVVPIDTVTPAADNPRRISPVAVDLVAKSLKRFGWKQPLVVDRFGTVVAGHTRLLAAQSLKLPTVPVVIAEDLTPEETKAFRIADNRTHDFSTWDLPQLAVQVDELAGAFAEELAVADWAAVMKEFESFTEESEESVPNSSPSDHDDPFDTDNSVDVPEEAAALLGRGTELVVVFSSQEAAAAGSARIIEIDGVVDVRLKR